MTREAQTHALVRTSPKGGPFFGTCIQCGMKNLPARAALMHCENVRGNTPSQSLLELIDDDKPSVN